MRNLPNITSLRFFLALLVVIFHITQFGANRGFPVFNYPPIFYKGTEAVYVFFSLSGFLIIRNLYAEKFSTGSISLKGFYKRRILRIFPLYYAVLIFGLFYYNIIVPRLGFDMEPRHYEIWQGIVLGGTFFSNIFATYFPGGILEILWSIGIEEQFYLFIAPLFLILPRKHILAFLLIFSVIYFILFNGPQIDALKYYKMLFYYFSVSGAVAILRLKYPDFKVAMVIKIAVYLLFLLYFLTDFFIDNLSDTLYQLFSVILFPILIICLIQKPNKVLESPKLKYLGKISYGIYMLHAIAMQISGFIFMKINSGFDNINPVIFILFFNLLTIGITILIAHLSYKYFESFFLKYKSAK